MSTTVWMGTLMPTPSVSVPQMTGSRPLLRKLFHQQAVARQHARHGARPRRTPSRRLSVLPNAVENRAPFMASLMASRCSLVATP